jgi:hypothetical protein
MGIKTKWFEIADGFRVSYDGLQYTVQNIVTTDPSHRFAKDDTPNERWVTIGYYSTTRAMVDKIVSLGVMELAPESVSTIIDAIVVVAGELLAQIKTANAEMRGE